MNDDYEDGHEAYQQGKLLDKSASEEWQNGWKDAEYEYDQMLEEYAYEEEYVSGYDACMEGSEYDPGQSSGWRSGWNDARDERLG